MRALVFASLVSVVAAAGTASAEKFNHVSDAKPKFELTDRAKPPKPQAEEKAHPELTAAQVLEVQGQLGAVRVEEAKILKQIVATAEDTDPDKPDALFRLAEIYAKQYRTFHIQAMDAQVAADKEKDAAKKSKLESEAKTKTKSADQALLDAAKTYTALTKNPAFKNFAQLDTALFYLGYTLQTAGKLQAARDVYDDLLKNYPSSKFVPEANLAFADYHFEAGEFADAETFYRKVLKFPKSSVYWYASYMLGWVQLNKKDAQGALETFYNVAQGTRGDKKQDVLHRASIKDFVRAYATIGKADKALEAFRRVDSANAYGMLDQLSDVYMAEGKADKAIYVLRQLMHDEPRDAKVCQWQQNVAREMLTMPNKGDQIHEIEELVRLYVALKDKKVLPAGELSECRDSAAEMSGQLARAYHQEAVKTQNAELVGYSDKLYRAYLSGFAGAPDYAETQYFHAELAWVRADMEKKSPRLQTQLWEDAAAAFTDVVATGKLDKGLVKVSADAAMQAWMRALAVDPRVHDRPAANEDYTKIPTPKPLPETEQKLLKAFDVYTTYVKDPKDDELVDVKFMRAALLRRHDHLEEAIAGFLDIIDHHREHETAEFAAQLALDSYNLLQQYDKMLALAEKLDADKKFMAGRDKLEETITGLRRTAGAKQAQATMERAEKAKDPALFIQAAEMYNAIYNAAPLAPDADVVLYNTGLAYEKGKSLGAAIGIFGQMKKLFPSSPQTSRAIGRLGAIYAQVAYYREAAGKLEEYAKNYAGEKDAYDALSDAVTYRKGVGDDDLAIADTELFLTKFGKTHPAEAATAAWSMTAIYEKQGDLDKLAKHLRRYIDGYGKTGGEDRLIAAYAKLGDALWKSSCPVATVDGSCATVSRTLSGVRLKVRASQAATVKTTCGDDDKVKVTVKPRDATRVRLAMAAFGSAISEMERVNKKTGGDERAALFFYATAKVGLAEKDFEDYMAIEMPTGLNFDPRNDSLAKKSHQRFDAWAESKSKVGGKAREQYEAVIGLHDGSTSIQAAARLGQIAQSFSGQLYRAEIPANLRVGEFAEDASQAYCDALEEKATPLEKRALNAYETCVNESTKLAWFSEWSRLCERELGQLDPSHWPTATEMRSAPAQVSVIVDVEGPARL